MNEENPTAGTMIWNANTHDFEGFDGHDWLSFTKPESLWGYQPEPLNIENQKFFASDGSAFDRFGGEIDISGDFAVVGASSD